MNLLNEKKATLTDHFISSYARGSPFFAGSPFRDEAVFQVCLDRRTSKLFDYQPTITARPEMSTHSHIFAGARIYRPVTDRTSTFDPRRGAGASAGGW